MKPLLICLVLFLLGVGFTACSQSKSSSTSKTMKDSKDSSGTIIRSEAEWKAQLSPEQYYVLREKGTERPFTGKFNLHFEKGTYTCAGCNAPLFSSDSKFESHCGWPSFDKEIAAGKILTKTDNSFGMRRTEILCARCGGHLGHVFDDGPTDTGLRYCVNSASLSFVKEGAEMPAEQHATETLILGGGCFWCVEAVYQQLEGVIKVESGYSGGARPNPTYEQVCSGATGHAEVVRIEYDPKKLSVEMLLKVFFTVHDPTTLNRQGADVGTQYRSVIFFTTPEQEKAAKAIIAELNAAGAYKSPIVTEVQAAKPFFKAEDYHQNYYNDNPNQGYCRMVIQPKLEKFEKVFHDRLKAKH